jgi:hypothetical protein
MYPKPVAWWIPLSLVAVFAALGFWFLLATQNSRVNASDVRVVTAPQPGGGTVVQVHTPATRSAVAPGGTVTRVAPVVAPPTGTLTDPAMVYTAERPAILVGRHVRADQAQVLSVVGDRTFWVGPSEEQKMFVRLRPGLDEGIMEKVVVMKPGQIVSIEGDLRGAPEGPNAPKWWRHRYSHGDVDHGEQIYLYADRIEFASP